MMKLLCLARPKWCRKDLQASDSLRPWQPGARGDCGKGFDFRTAGADLSRPILL
jgi:hypothetical protein